MQLNKLSDYPAAIAGMERRALKMTQDTRLLRESLLNITTEADRIVAEESKLKVLTNDQQRKTRKQELLDSNPDYALVQRQLQDVEDALGELQITINLYRAEFSILKLEQREKIAQMELSATATAA